MYRRWGKRLLDVVLTVVALALLAPVMMMVALLVRLKLGAPVLFRQQRAGLNGEPFTLYKFRTMTNARDSQGCLLPDEQRITPLGRLLRSTSIDELPELWNVLKGDMSLVGPRPLLIEYLPYYTEREQERHSVLPGITGLAQISGRNQLGWDERLELDIEYVENMSFILDLSILWNTLWKVMLVEGVVTVPSTELATLTEYRRNRDEGSES